MPYGDDLDARFQELVAQFSEEERRRLSAAASKGARPRRRRRAWRVRYAVAAVLAVVVAALLIVVFRPGMVSPAHEPPAEPSSPVLRALASGASGDANTA
ncbi:hypothetical protein ACQEUU_15775 [Nonomuraea sp. CA-218870]|uniref:hypothetical protein n=1 Tax=Nonomuraea sp. CA-218870 TaxID=3239998 RepID=UPI003D8FFF9E